MATFYKCINNGTVAIVSEQAYRQIVTHIDWADQVRKTLPEWGPSQPGYPEYPKPIFTFVSPEHYKKTHLRHFVTGDYVLMDELLHGHLVLEGSFYVPFSNSAELNEDEDGPEHKFRTTVAEVVEAFELFSEPSRFSTSSI